MTDEKIASWALIGALAAVLVAYAIAKVTMWADL
jgi:hypothetical protein